MGAFLILQPDVPDVDVSEDILFSGTGKVGIDGKGCLRRPALIEAQGVEVGIPVVEVKLVQGVTGLGREVDQALEQEIEIGIGADDAPVEIVILISARTCDVAVFVTVDDGFVNMERVDTQTDTALAHACIHPRPQRAFFHFIRPQQAPDIEIVDGHRTAETGW